MKFIFTDIETTGLSKSADMIELASIAFDKELHAIDSFNMLILPIGMEPDDDHPGPSEEALAKRFEERALDMARKSGLFMDLLSPNAKPLALVASEYVAWLERVKTYGDDKDLRLCGNNVEGFDMRFISRDIREATSYFHYRMLNVSSLRTTFASANGMDEEKIKKHYGFGKHRAIDDCQASFREWADYRKVFHLGRHTLDVYHKQEEG